MKKMLVLAGDFHVKLRDKGLHIPTEITGTTCCYLTIYCVHNLKNYNQNTLFSGTPPPPVVCKECLCNLSTRVTIRPSTCSSECSLGARMHIPRSGTLDFAVYDTHVYSIKIILYMTMVNWEFKCNVICMDVLISKLVRVGEV
jgi:hypothetical protein